MRSLSIAFTAASVLVGFQGMGQQDEGNPSLNQEIIAIGNRQIKLRDAYRISKQPELFDTTITKSNITYEVKQVVQKTQYQVQPIQAANLRIVEPLNKLQRLYVKAGVGMFTSPIGELYFNSLRSRNGAFGLGLQHHSSAGGIKNVLSNGAFSSNAAQLWGKTFLGKHVLGGQFDYTRDKQYYYGYRPSMVTLEGANALQLGQIEQVYDRFSGEINLQSFFDGTKKLNHREDLFYHRLTNIQGTAEQRIAGTADFSKKFGNETVSIKIGVDNTAISYADASKTDWNNTIVTFNPRVTTSSEKFSVKAGMLLQTQIDTNSRFYFFPDAEASYQLVPGILVPYAGISGAVNRNSFHALSLAAPFVNANPNLRNTVDKYRIYAGVRGNVSSHISFHLSVEQRLSDQFMMMLTDSAAPENTLSAVYDRVAQTAAKAELAYHKIKKLDLGVSVAYVL
ncbi:MAG TPA: hypothetical protein VFV37_07885, partial [Luteibaculaceae bacterium]|nr:hypothetical protein [Luteibaculaceae bacterium]